MNSFKFIDVASDKRQTMHQCNRGNLQIIWPDDPRSTFKAVSDRSVSIRTWIVKGKRSYIGKQLRDFQSSSMNVAVFLGIMHQFRTNNRTNCQFRMIDLREPINTEEILSFENLDPDIRIQQLTHYHVFAEGIGSSSGSSGSSSAQHPMMSAKSGRLRFNSSRVGRSFSLSTSEITSLQRDSNTRAFSGARRSKVHSKSKAIVIMGIDCHGIAENSTFHFTTL